MLPRTISRKNASARVASIFTELENMLKQYQNDPMPDSELFNRSWVDDIQKHADELYALMRLRVRENDLPKTTWRDGAYIEYTPQYVFSRNV